MHRAILPITTALLFERLGIPADAILLGIRTDPFVASDVAELIIEHPSLPYVREGERAPHLNVGPDQHDWTIKADPW